MRLTGTNLTAFVLVGVMLPTATDDCLPCSGVDELAIELATRELSGTSPALGRNHEHPVSLSGDESSGETVLAWVLRSIVGPGAVLSSWRCEG